MDRDPALGWGRLSTRVEVYEVPGNHLMMMEQPHVRALAEALHACLLRSDRPLSAQGIYPTVAGSPK
jgi:thioesterase domain-containing protein